MRALALSRTAVPALCGRKRTRGRPVGTSRQAMEASTSCEAPPKARAEVASTPSACPFQACASPIIAAALPEHYADVCQAWPDSGKLPIVYHARYNISFFGLEKLHPFDSCKFYKVIDALVKAGLVRHEQLVTPKEASLQCLSDVHSEEYLHALHHNNMTVVQVTELPPLMMLPNKLLQWRVVSPMKHHVGGTMLAAGVALQYGWAINIGGGMHHASRDGGGGWCPFDDLYLAARRVRAASGKAVQKIVVVDLDAHQGNGVERDKLHFKDDDLIILDMYNGWAYPRDDAAKRGINVAVELAPRTGDDVYLFKLASALEELKAACGGRPDLVLYNAGTDILDSDPLGRLAVSREGIKQRDEMVWSFALQLGAPICMVLSGGYAKNSAGVISESLTNLFHKFKLAASAQ